VKIRAKIVFVVVPILMTSLIITGVVSSFSARSGMTRIAMEFLGFKADELENYAYSQWNLLVQNNLQDDTRYLEVGQNAVASYAQSIVRSDTELILALDQDAKAAMSTGEVELSVVEKARLYRKIHQQNEGWINLNISGVDRVGQAFFFEPFNWYVMVTETNATFYREADQIIINTAYFLGGSIVISLLLLFLFTGYLTRPLRSVVTGMRHIIETNDMSERVPVEYNDEIGALAHTFNIMSGELERAYNQIKEFAFKAVLAQKNEHKVRSIFQKYVPKDVIDTIFMNPEKMLVGDNRVVAILFSDIRSFTTISEGFMPDELVSALNRYFELMVDILMHHGGVIDKYIGDAIMAFFGAPVKRPDDALQSVLAALEMQQALEIFNSEQEKAGKPRFNTGIGINYGVVTVGNIGSEKKMDYTIIGDMVNLGSRLEGLTKYYHQKIIFSESVYRKVKGQIKCRMVDKVVVKGKTKGENIYTAELNLNERQKKAWMYYHAGLQNYYKRKYQNALKYFLAAKKLAGDDYLADLYLERTRGYIKNPPGADWTGLEVLTSK